MVRRLYDFKCSHWHTIEKFIDDSVNDIPCPSCGRLAGRQVSAHSIPYGVMGANWASDRAKKQAKEKA
jgi:hypothetical protein